MEDFKLNIIEGNYSIFNNIITINDRIKLYFRERKHNITAKKPKNFLSIGWSKYFSSIYPVTDQLPENWETLNLLELIKSGINQFKVEYDKVEYLLQFDFKKKEVDFKPIQ